MSKPFSFVQTSFLRATPAEVWKQAGTFAGVNQELWPLAQMTYPRARARLTPAAFPLGEHTFRSWILLFGLVPVDFDDVLFLSLEPERGFVEGSRMGSMQAWRHERTLTPTSTGCRVEDTLTFVPHFSLAGPLLAWVYRLVFTWRHRVLRQRFGTQRRSGASSAASR